MTTKLTLSVEKDTIETAKLYAKNQNKSLSEIIENYLKVLVQDTKEEQVIDREIVELSDSIDPKTIPDLSEIRFKYLKEKYIHE
jgi:hypothetical protein